MNTRHKDANWQLPEKAEDWTQVQTAVLMDIRDELKELNSKLNCYRVRRMLDAVQRIDTRLAKRIKLK